MLGVIESKHCKDCANAELHGFSYLAERMRWPVTVSFYCPLKRHHDINREACELFEPGEAKKVYDDVDW